MTRMLIAGTVALVLVIGALEAAPAMSGPPVPGPIDEHSATASASGNGSIATATATCPPGTRAAGGGFDAPSSITGIPLVYESVKVDQRSWRASAQYLDMGEPTTMTLTAYVYCRDHYPVTWTNGATRPTNGQVQVGPTATASCLPGEVALAGGFVMPPPLHSPSVDSLFFDSFRNGVGDWSTRVVTGPAGPSSFTSEAYCAKHGNPPTGVTATSAGNNRDMTTSSSTAYCPAGQSPAAGGFAQPDSDITSFLFLTESRRVGSGWRATALHSGNDPAVSLVAAGYCG
jgi:hypothetical protein